MRRQRPAHQRSNAMIKNLTPSPANGPLRPEGQNSIIQLLRELIQLVSKMLDKLSESAFVILAVMAFKGTMEFLYAASGTTDAIAFACLGTYLTKNLMELRQKPK